MESNFTLRRCPVCRARFSGDEADDERCRRCSSDLTLLRRTYRRAWNLRARARRDLNQGDAVGALTLARSAVELVDVTETRKTLAAALVATGHLHLAELVLIGKSFT